MWILATECKKQIQARALEAPSKLHLYHLDLICFTYILLCWFLLLQASWNHLRDTSFKKIRTDRVRERRREGEKGEKLWIERTRRERVRRHRNQTWEKRKRKGNGFYFVFCILKKTQLVSPGVQSHEHIFVKGTHWDFQAGPPMPVELERG